jgi:GNAT superfamily N-acetyltransferase/cytidine deaminase
MDFEAMIKEAEKALREKENAKCVATALLTDKGNLYVNICDDFCQGLGEKLCEACTPLNEMIAAGETGIHKMVSVWKDGAQMGVEIPCAWYRQFIKDMNPQNSDAEVMLGGSRIHKMKELVPPLKTRLEIRKLEPALLEDYLDYFDNVAFSDHPEWSWCYCTFYHLGEEDEKKLEAENAGRFNREVLRNVAIRMIKDRSLNGYLAYDGGSVVGWCNAADKKNYKKLCEKREIWEEGETVPTKAVTCFIVAPEARRKGVAAALLARVAEDAASEGYKVVEAYPAAGEQDCYGHYHGHPAMYEKSGFIRYKDFAAYSVYRKLL